MADNLHIWKRVSKTPSQYKRDEVIKGRRLTVIDPYYLIKRATQLWGPYGSSWGLKSTSLEVVQIRDTHLAIYKAVFWYPHGEFPIYNSILVGYQTRKGYFTVDDEFTKKVETNTVSKALSKLGFAADVYLGEFEEVPREMATGPQEFPDDVVMVAIQAAKSVEELLKIYEQLTPQQREDEGILAAFKERKKSLKSKP